MHVFHIKGFSGILFLLFAVLSALVVFLLLPATFMMVLWNALVFEGLKGPELDLYQGFLLWGAMLVLIKLVFKPEIQLQFQKHSAAKPVAKSKKSLAAPEKKESNAEEPTTTVVMDDSSPLDKQS